jgi:diguanylate cyclase (GGDEF)-like protein
MTITELTEYGSLLKPLLENLVSAVFLVDKKGTIWYSNEAYRTLFHKSGDEIPGQTCDGSFGCSACKLRDSLVGILTHHIPARQERLTRKFFINNQEVAKYFIYSAQNTRINDEDLILVILDDITETMDARLALKRMAVTDGLTDLYNHRHLYYKLEEELTRANRYGNRLSVIMLDIDRFKAINDAHGHQVGDDTLVTISHIVKSNLRDIDIAGRYDSVEFMLILPQTSLDNAFLIAERIRKTIENHSFERKGLKVTVSGGVAEFQKEHKSALHLIDKAEHLLYQAKEKGRNRVEK